MTSPCAICAAAAGPRPENPYAPFCSARCRTIDLGRWVSGDYRIPVATDDVDDEGGLFPLPLDSEASR